MLAKTLGSS